MMDIITARKRIYELHQKDLNAYSGVKEEEYKQIYYSIQSHIDKGDYEWREAVAFFLINGSLHFDRFTTPRPNSVDDEQYDMFCRFVKSFQKVCRNDDGTNALLSIHKIKWDVFRRCNCKPLDDDTKAFLNGCLDKTNKISFQADNNNNSRIAEDEKSQLLSLISDLLSNKIYTTFRTFLPYKLTNRNSTIHLVMDGVDADVKIINRSQGSSLPNISIAEGSAMETFGPSRWTTASSDLEIVYHCLIDGLDALPRVTIHRQENEKFYWTLCFDVVYRFISSIWGHLQDTEKSYSKAFPLPNDMHWIDYRIKSDNLEYDGQFSTNPALVYHIESLNKDPEQYDFGEVGMPSWSTLSYFYARTSAESGQLDEAVFWINVSVEALIDEFIQQVATDDCILKTIMGDEHKYDEAEKILSDQFPEMKGKVKWPQYDIHASVFTKLKRALKYAPGSLQKKEVLKHYSHVSDKRNHLFHGGVISITSDDVEKAFGSYEWLRDNLCCK